MTFRDLRDANVCIASRSLPNGTGVTTYSDAVAAALAINQLQPISLVAKSNCEGLMARASRWLAALTPGARPLSSSNDGHTLVGEDVYRIAQVHFDINRGAMPLTAPWPKGLVHWTYPVPLWIRGWINIYTIHDVIPLLQPELSPIPAGRHRRLLSAIARHADLIVTVSDTSRLDIIRQMELPVEKVANLGAGLRPGTQAALERSNHLLVCGSVEPRKNIVRIVEAYRRSGTQRTLIIAGPDGWKSAEIRAEIGEVPGVSWLPYLHRNALLGLVASARALLMPSLAEGFGLPVAEAMSLGTPVLTSDRGALAEIAGGAALAVNPYDLDALATGIRRISNDDDLWRDLRVKGLNRAQSFRLDRFGERLIDAYCRCIATSSPAT